jgi:hypothetical protein
MTPFTTNINGLLSRMYNLSKLILFVDGYSSIISSEKLDYFCAVSNTIPSHMNKLFTAYNLAIDLDKTRTIQHRMSLSLQYPFITMQCEKLYG